MNRLRRMILATILCTSFMVLFGNMADAKHATLKVVNISSWPITKFYASPYWHKSYTGDLLGSYIIYPRQHWFVDLSDGNTENCIYDVKVTLQNGQIFEDRINVCGQTLTIHNR